MIVELKSAEKVNAAHKKQLLTCLRLTGMKLDNLLNFGKYLRKEVPESLMETYFPFSVPPWLREKESQANHGR